MYGKAEDAIPTDELRLENIPGLYSYAMVLTRNPAEAEDLVQETYVRAIPAMARLRKDSNLKGWLFEILRNVWFNQLRQRRSRPVVVPVDTGNDPIDNLVDPRKDSYETYASKVERVRVQAAIQKLPEVFREIILLREFEELSYQEIAQILHCPAGTVMSRLARARSQLRELLLPNVKGQAGLRGEQHES
jgi:RNA polymerase sigma-70 factor, ECF subfamily